MMRFNLPFGEVGKREFGTYFIGYARNPHVIEQMLTNMFIGQPPGTHDRILDFSTAFTGNLFFVPNVNFLDGQPDFSTPATTAGGNKGTPEGDSSPSDGSLGVGSLRQATP
ncbi:MAG: Dyp-type peroxidase [Solirubrobacteraceae bacterium]